MARKSKAKFTMKGHTLPGIKQDPAMHSKTSDYRHESSAFQMQQPGDSPLQKGFWKKALNVATGGLAGGIGKAIKGDWKGALGSLGTGGMSSFAPDKLKSKVEAGPPGLGGGGGGGGDAAAGAQLLKEEAKAEMGA